MRDSKGDQLTEAERLSGEVNRQAGRLCRITKTPNITREAPRELHRWALKGGVKGRHKAHAREPHTADEPPYLSPPPQLHRPHPKAMSLMMSLIAGHELIALPTRQRA